MRWLQKDTQTNVALITGFCLVCSAAVTGLLQLAQGGDTVRHIHEVPAPAQTGVGVVSPVNPGDTRSGSLISPPVFWSPETDLLKANPPVGESTPSGTATVTESWSSGAANIEVARVPFEYGPAMDRLPDVIRSADAVPLKPKQLELRVDPDRDLGLVHGRNLLAEKSESRIFAESWLARLLRLQLFEVDEDQIAEAARSARYLGLTSDRKHRWVFTTPVDIDHLSPAELAATPQFSPVQ